MVGKPMRRTLWHYDAPYMLRGIYLMLDIPPVWTFVGTLLDDIGHVSGQLSATRTTVRRSRRPYLSIARHKPLWSMAYSVHDYKS